MPGRDDQLRNEIENLWTEVFGEPPAIRCEAKLLAEVLVRSLSSPPPYGDPPGLRDREPLPPHRPAPVTNSVADPN
jgi:hypothetical protein